MAGAHPFFFYADTLVERRTRVGVRGTGRVDFVRPAGPNALFFSFSLVFPFLFFAPVLLFRSLHRGENMALVPHSHRKPSTTGEGLILWRVWGKADINVAGTRIEPRDRGEPQPVKNTLDFFPC